MRRRMIYRTNNTITGRLVRLARTSRGFTLIELMVVVAVIGILSAIAYPSYKEHVARGNRNDAKGVLLEDAQWLERNYTTSNAYNLDGANATLTATSALAWPTAPRDGTTRYYNVTFASAPTASAYTIAATPIAGTPMANDRCGTLTYTNTGVKGAAGATSGGVVDDCWSR